MLKLLASNDNNWYGNTLKKAQSQDLDVLLQLNNEIFPMENGYWTKIEAHLVVVNTHIPHGIKYQQFSIYVISISYKKPQEIYVQNNIGINVIN